MDFDNFTFRQIDADTRIKSFDCGDSDLNDFLLSDAHNYYKSMMALTYLLEDNETDRTVGENEAAEYFNPQGIRVATPENGLFIRRQGNTVTKVLVK